MRQLVLAGALLVLGAFAGRASDARRATPRAPPGAASLLGGFSALAVQVLWQRADQAVSEHREDDAQVAFAAIEELEPQLVSGGDFIARSLGFDLAAGHEDPAVRWSFAREGRRVLDRVVEMNPGDPLAYAVRGRYSLNRMKTPEFRERYEREFEKEGPFESARLDLARATSLRPQWLEPWVELAITSSVRGTELFESGDFAGAGTLYRDARRAYGKVVGFFADSVDAKSIGYRDDSAGAARLMGALADVCDAPPDARAARLDELRRKIPDAALPELPKR